MSLNSLINEQIKQVLNKNTNTIIESISEKLNVSRYTLVDIWNKLNNEFKIKNIPQIIEPEIIDEDIMCVEVLEEEIMPETHVVIIDEDI
jgi:hypothetical protein